MTARRRGTFRYVPASELLSRPHVVVDGAPGPGSLYTLSHWPATPTPRSLWADTSAEIVLRARNRPRALPAGAELATVDHYDADGVIALGLLVDDALAAHHAPELRSAAWVGDFDVVSERPPALVAFALAALAGEGGTEAATERALAQLPALAAHPERFEELWGHEADAFDAACELRRRGAVTVAENRRLDLAVVRVDEDAALLGRAGWRDAPVHPAAIHSVTSCLRVATIVGRRYDVRYRYESWVRLVSRGVMPRVDLDPLALTLEAAEEDGGRWVFEGTGAITPALRRADGAESTLSPERFLSELQRALAEGRRARTLRRAGLSGRRRSRSRTGAGPTAGTTG